MTISFSDIYILTPMTANDAPVDDASASSEYSSNYPSWRAFNQDANATNQSWVSQTINVDACAEWVKRHLDTPATVRAFKFKSRGSDVCSSPKDFILQGSNDDLNWTDLYTATGYVSSRPAGSETFYIDSQQSFSYYRLYVTKGHDLGLAAIAVGELELYGTYAPATPFLGADSQFGCTVTSSSDLSAQYAGWKAFNGCRNDDNWISAAAPTVEAPQWLKFDFGAGNAKTIEAYAFRLRNSASRSYPVDFILQGSNDDSAWTDLHTVTGLTNLGQDALTDCYNIASPAEFRYYRLYITACQSGGSWVAVGQMYLYVSATLPPPPVLVEWADQVYVNYYAAEALAPAPVGASYEHTFGIIDSLLTLTFSIQSGSLPAGLALESLAGNKLRLYGTPTTPGEYEFVIRAEDDADEDNYGDKAFSILVPGSGTPGAGICVVY